MKAPSESGMLVQRTNGRHGACAFSMERALSEGMVKAMRNIVHGLVSKRMERKRRCRYEVVIQGMGAVRTK